MRSRKGKTVIEENTRTGFVDITHFDHHLGPGNDPHPTSIYGSAELLLEGQECAKTCGIYEVEVKVLRVARKPRRGGTLTEAQAYDYQIKKAWEHLEKKKKELVSACGHLAKVLEEKQKYLKEKASAKPNPKKKS